MHTTRAKQIGDFQHWLLSLDIFSDLLQALDQQGRFVLSREVLIVSQNAKSGVNLAHTYIVGDVNRLHSPVVLSCPKNRRFSEPFGSWVKLTRQIGAQVLQIDFAPGDVEYQICIGQKSLLNFKIVDCLLLDAMNQGVDEWKVSFKIGLLVVRRFRGLGHG